MTFAKGFFFRDYQAEHAGEMGSRGVGPFTQGVVGARGEANMLVSWGVREVHDTSVGMSERWINSIRRSGNVCSGANWPPCKLLLHHVLCCHMWPRNDQSETN